MLCLGLHYHFSHTPWISHSTSLIFGNCSRKGPPKFSQWNIWNFIKFLLTHSLGSWNNCSIEVTSPVGCNFRPKNLLRSIICCNLMQIIHSRSEILIWLNDPYLHGEKVNYFPLGFFVINPVKAFSFNNKLDFKSKSYTNRVAFKFKVKVFWIRKFA